MPARAKLVAISQLVILVAALAGAALVSTQDQWEPLNLVAILLVLAVASDLLAVRTKQVHISAAFLCLVLAMALAGPAPAVFIGVVSVGIASLRTKLTKLQVLINLATYATFPLIGGILIQGLAHEVGIQPDDVGFGLLVFGAFCLAIVLNFAMITVHSRLLTGRSFRTMFETVFVPVLPSELATALLTVGIAAVYTRAGLAALALFAVAMLVFQRLLGELLKSQERAEQLEERTTQLASLQVGVLAAMIQTLSLRDHMTARHCAAVARYSREIARAAGLSQEEQDLVHIAGLLHDIGKFIFPDSILLANRRLDDDDWEIVKRHPAQGAKVVRQVDGYGPVADIILAHHERIDGKGYPSGIAGENIPKLSRIISVADTYDTMTARDSYRNPVEPADAINELRRVSGAQLDGFFVEVFVDLLERKGVAFRHGDDADFEAELAFEKRVRSWAEPPAAAVAAAS
jgi:putative nucleotidyltransferase with HDIG domain